jgi:hypothetical protein
MEDSDDTLKMMKIGRNCPQRKREIPGNLGGDLMTVKYEVWAGVGKARKRVSRGFQTEDEARKAMTKLKGQGFDHLVIVQLPPRYGNIRGLARKGRL